MQCEAMILIVGKSKPQGFYLQCGHEPAHLHHKITRARGGAPSTTRWHTTRARRSSVACC
jgi:hypothetical protein